jgi:hypothetical protein
MMRRTLCLVIALACAAAALTASGKELVREFSGTGTATTAEFEVTAPWILDWRVNSEYQASMAIEISLVDARTGFHSGLILQTKYPGNGVKLFNEGGHYRFRVSSTLSKWNLKIEELTPDEAEQYTPRRQNGAF